MLAFVLAWPLLACGADPKTIEGALARGASAVASRDYGELFESLDERSRHALASSYYARKEAAQVIRESYPPALQATALRELGDAAMADSPVALFRRRCGDCMDAFAGVLGAPRTIREDAREVTVETVRGTEAHLYRGDDGRYGLVWETAALLRERSRSAAELDLIKRNAEQYRKQRSLK